MKKLHIIGNAHLDPAWIWPWQEGFGEVKATFLSALNRLDEFDDIIFTSSSAQYYEWIEENEPEMFLKIKEKISQGRWVLCGGWWIQPDCNLPCGESFIRQGLLGQTYFKDKFGVNATVGYNVDSFGHNSSLPQILKGSGMHSYVFLRPGPQEKGLPGNVFLWEGNDGSRVTACRIPFAYNTGINLSSHYTNCLHSFDPSLSHSLCFYGVGNHGGGPTIASIKYIKEEQQKQTDIQVVFSDPNTFFDEIKGSEELFPVYRGDLQHHASGCYSVNSEIKALNRKAENALLKAEKYSVIAELYGIPAYHDFKNAWKRILFNQFHDILAGASIPEVYEDAQAQLGEAVSVARDAENHALQRFSFHINIPFEQDMQPLVVFNSHSFAVSSVICHEKGSWGNFSFPETCKVTNSTGEEVPYQFIRTKAQLDERRQIAFLAKIPPMGYETFCISPRTTAQAELFQKPGNPCVLENQCIRVVFDPETGYICSIYDKSEKIEVVDGYANVPLVMEDLSDTWSHGITKFDKEIGRFQLRSIKKVEEGPLLSSIRVSFVYENSVLTQVFTLQCDGPEIYVKSVLFWQEHLKCLKIQFPLAISNPVSTYENPFGNIVRPANGDEEVMQSWLDVTGESAETGHAYGFGLINNNKYSADIHNSSIRLTILRSPVFSHHEPRELDGDLEDYTFTDQGKHEFDYLMVPHRSDWRFALLPQKALVFNQPLTKVVETYHNGTFPQKLSAVTIRDENIILTALKKACHSDHYILRAYESFGKKTDTVIEIPILNKKIQAHFMPYQIKTFSISPNEFESVYETDLIENPIDETKKED